MGAAGVVDTELQPIRIAVKASNKMSAAIFMDAKSSLQSTPQGTRRRAIIPVDTSGLTKM
jgi:hypothetical protein